MSQYGTKFSDLQDAIWNWLHTALNRQADFTTLDENDPAAIPVFEALAGVVRPDARLYCEWNFLGTPTKIGSMDELINATANTYKLRGQREFSISVNFVGTGAIEAAVQCQQFLDLPTGMDILRGAGLAVRGNEVIADQTTFLETSFEERAVLDVILGLTLELADSVKSIESVEVTSNLPGGVTQVVDTL